MEREFNDQQLARRKKLDDLKEKGIKPFGNAYKRNANSKSIKDNYSELSKEELLEYAAHCEAYSNHPIGRSISKEYGKTLDKDRIISIKEHAGKGIEAVIDNRAVLVGNEKLLKNHGIEAMHCDDDGTIVHVAIDNEYVGHIHIGDRIKENARLAIDELKSNGVKKTIMLTGDEEKIALAVCEKLGIDEVHYELLPQDKVTEVEKLLKEKDEKDTLAFVGDGINDAPVISIADVGIAMGSLGSDAAIEAADVVLMDDDPLKIAKAIKISRKCLRIVKENIGFALGVKIVCLILAAIGIANMWVAIAADVGVMILAVLNAIRCLFVKNL